MVRRRHISVAEHWLVQGFAHPGLPGVPSTCKRHFPFPSIVHGGSSSGKRRSEVQRKLTGNSMHWAAIGLWFAYNMGMSRRMA